MRIEKTGGSVQQDKDMQRSALPVEYATGDTRFYQHSFGQGGVTLTVVKNILIQQPSPAR